MKIRQAIRTLLFTVVLVGVMAFGGKQDGTPRHRIGALCNDGKPAPQLAVVLVHTMAASRAGSTAMARAPNLRRRSDMKITIASLVSSLCTFLHPRKNST